MSTLHLRIHSFALRVFAIVLALLSAIRMTNIVQRKLMSAKFQNILSALYHVKNLQQRLMGNSADSDEAA